MKIKAFQVEETVAGITTSGMSSCLLYGPNLGLIFVLTSSIIDAFVAKGFSLINIDGAKVDTSPDVINAEVFNCGLFGDKKIIRVRGATNKSSAVIDKILKSEHFDKDSVFIVSVAEELDTKSSLRTMYEKGTNCAALPCYADDARSNERVVKKFFADRSVQASPNVVRLIASSFSGDRMNLMSDLEKIHLYIGERSAVTELDCEKLLAEEKEVGVDELMDAIGTKDAAAALAALNFLNDKAVAHVSIVRAMVYHFQKLRKVKINVQNGSPIETEMTREFIFFKRVEKFSRQIAASNVENLSEYLVKLSDLEIGVKANSANGDLCMAEISAFICDFCQQGASSVGAKQTQR